jgi:hyperosmotically inducible protein
MRFLLALIVGIGIGAAAVWFYWDSQSKPRLQTAEEPAQEAAKSPRDTIQDELRSLHLSSSEISNELAHTGVVIRQKAQEVGNAIAKATADSRITAAIKARLLRDPDLSAWNISVNTTGGVVTLSGTVSSAENIGKAMVLAMNTEGVSHVISTLQVKPK